MNKPESKGASTFSNASETHPDEPIDETPALHAEQDIPSDGGDPEGEEMIRQVPASGGSSPADSASESPDESEGNGDKRA